MNSKLNNTDATTKTIVAKEYMQNDFTVFNAYMDGLVNNQAAQIEHNGFVRKTHQLKLFILFLIALLILSGSAFFWILSSKSTSLQFFMASDRNITSEVAVEKVRAKAQSKLDEKIAEDLKSTAPNLVTIIRDFTIFETVKVNASELDNILSVTTGSKFLTSDNKLPSHQYCYANGTKMLGNANIRIDVASFINGRPKPELIDDKGLEELNIRRQTFEKLIDYCRFE